MTFLIVRLTQFYLVVVLNLVCLPEQEERSVWNSDRSPPSPVRLASWS